MGEEPNRPRRSILGDLRHLSEVAGVLLAIALFIGGAGPSVLLKLLGLDDAASMVGSIVSTAPLSLTLGAVLIIVAVYADSVSAAGLLTLSFLAVTGSLLLAQWTGVIRPEDVSPDLLGGGGRYTGPVGMISRVVDTLGLFLRAYGVERFAGAIAGGIFLAYAYVAVLLPRLRRTEPPEGRA